MYFLIWMKKNKYIYNINYDSKNEVSNLNIRRWQLIRFSFIDASYLIINSTERLFDDVCDCNVSTRLKLWRKVFNKSDLISKFFSIFDRFSNKLLNVICNSLCIDFDVESQTSILSIDDFIEKDENRFLLLVLYNHWIITIWLWILFDEFIKKRQKRKKKYTCWIYEYINWSSSTNTSRIKKRNFARFNRSSFFYSYSSILMTWFICKILIIDIFLLISYDDVSYWTDFISTRILIRWKKIDDVKIFIQLLLTIWSIIIFEEHWT
jgi:hypothetical protein